MTIEWGVMPAEYRDVMGESLALDAQHRAAVAACEAATGHDWRITLNPAEVRDDIPVKDDPAPVTGTVMVRCPTCGAGVDDICPDGWEFLFGEVDGVTIQCGAHESLAEVADRPVTVELRVERYSSADGDDVNIWIEVKDR